MKINGNIANKYDEIIYIYIFFTIKIRKIPNKIMKIIIFFINKQTN